MCLEPFFPHFHWWGRGTVTQSPAGIYAAQAGVRTLFPQARTWRPGSPSPSLSLSSWSYVARLLITIPPSSYAWICIKQRHGSACNVCHGWNGKEQDRPDHTARSPSKFGWQVVRAQHQYRAAREPRFMRLTKIDTLMVFHFHSFNIRSLWHCLYSTPLHSEQRAPNSQWWRGRRI